MPSLVQTFVPSLLSMAILRQAFGKLLFDKLDDTTLLILPSI